MVASKGKRQGAAMGAGEPEDMLEQASLEVLESKALAALVRQAREGSAVAAKAALAEADRVRKTRLGELHRQRMDELVDRPVALAAYLATLGLSIEQVETWFGRKLKGPEQAAWKQAEKERVLEVRAIEIGRCRRGDGEIPKWARGKL